MTVAKIKHEEEETLESLKYMKPSNEWDIEGLRKARNNSDGEEVLCTATKEPLYYIRSDSLFVPLQSHGPCYNCGYEFHKDYLVFNGNERDPWPIRYLGRWCKDCQKLPPEEWNEKPEDWSKI